MTYVGYSICLVECSRFSGCRPKKKIIPRQNKTKSSKNLQFSLPRSNLWFDISMYHEWLEIEMKIAIFLIKKMDDFLSQSIDVFESEQTVNLNQLMNSMESGRCSNILEQRSEKNPVFYCQRHSRQQYFLVQSRPKL